MRGISIRYVADQTRLGEARIEAIEAGRTTLRGDGRDRVTVRALAQAIGADPHEAVAQLRGSRAEGAAAGPERPRRRWIDWLPLAAALVVVLGLGGLGLWLLLPGGDADTPPVVFRADYVDRLLDEPASQ